MADSTDNIIVDTATRIFQDLCEPNTVNEAEQGVWPKALWDALEESGLTLTWVPDELGGAGATLADGFAVLRASGRFAAPVPLAETLMAGWLLTQAGIAVPGGPLTIAPIHADGRIGLTADGALSGRARRVPFARSAGHITVLAHRGNETVVALVAAAGLSIRRSTSLAGEPRDDVSFDGAFPDDVRPTAIDQDLLVCFGAAVRLQQIAGALEKILEQSVQYALDRSQFGRPIAKFQAVQHNLATLAGEVAAASAAAAAAAEACSGAEIGIAAAARRLAPVPRLRIRCMVRWALPTSIRCITPHAGCGHGARSSATRRCGPSASGGWSRRTAPTSSGPSSPKAHKDPRLIKTMGSRGTDEFELPLRPDRIAARGQGIAPGGPCVSAPGSGGWNLCPGRRQGVVFA